MSIWGSIETTAPLAPIARNNYTGEPIDGGGVEPFVDVAIAPGWHTTDVVRFTVVDDHGHDACLLLTLDEVAALIARLDLAARLVNAKRRAHNI